MLVVKCSRSWWLSGEGSPCTWKELIETLEETNFRELAQQLEVRLDHYNIVNHYSVLELHSYCKFTTVSLWTFSYYAMVHVKSG